MRGYLDIIKIEPSEPIYRLLSSFLYKIGVPFWLYIFIFSAFIFIVLGIFLEKNTSYPELGLLMYISFDFYILSHTMLRQCVAMAIYIIYFIWRKNDRHDWLRFLVCALFAVGFHTASLVFAPAYILTKLKYKKITVSIMVLMALVTLVLNKQLVKGLILLAGMIDTHYKLYDFQLQTGTYIGLKFYLLLWVVLIMALLLCGSAGLEKNSEYIYLLLMAIILFPLGMTVGSVIIRIMYFFGIYIIALVPNIAKEIRSNLNRYTFVSVPLAVGVLYYCNAVYSNTLSILPYRFFWMNN